MTGLTKPLQGSEALQPGILEVAAAVPFTGGARIRIRNMEHPFFLRLAYVGGAFHGWQIQSTLPSVQRELWRALQVLDPQVPLPQGTGRTDAGVHARAQGVLVKMARTWEPYRLLAALNAHLPPEVRVMECQPAPEGFWPRQHAVAKRYAYRIEEGPAADPFSHGRCWHVRLATPLDRKAIWQASRHLIGERDFSSFRHQECVAKSPIRKIFEIFLEESGPRLTLAFEGNRFLMHQVRIMAGTLIEVGRGRLRPGDLADILEGRDRRLAGRTAPPEGLCLEKVWYQSRWGIGEPCPWGEPEP